MRRFINIRVGAVMCSPFYDIMGLLQMSRLPERSSL
jgi:hypothetical protein